MKDLLHDINTCRNVKSAVRTPLASCATVNVNVLNLKLNVISKWNMKKKQKETQYQDRNWSADLLFGLKVGQNHFNEEGKR